MPVVTVEASKNLSKETKKEMIEPIQTITMIIRENIPENIGVAGKPVSEE